MKYAKTQYKENNRRWGYNKHKHYDFYFFFSPQLQLIVLGRCPDSDASGWGWRAGGGGDRDGVSGGWPEWWTVRASRETMVCMARLYWLDPYPGGLTVFLFSRMKEVTVTDKKVLLVCTGGRYSAVGGQCSHYSAPLVKGAPSTTLRPCVFVYRKEKYFAIYLHNLWFVINPGVLVGERVRCPFHGACFNVRTGDIEDYPGLDCLPTYKVSHPRICSCS